MIAAGSGTILVTTGGGSITPVPFLANVNIAATGLRNWILNLRTELKPKLGTVVGIGQAAQIRGEGFAAQLSTEEAVDRLDDGLFTE
jgi:hypothetical protein